MKNNIDYPLLSIIIVTKNNERTLPRLLKNISEQTYPKNKLEIIVIDGKSQDNTKQIIQKSGLDIRFRVGRIPNDPEICKGEGLSLAKGDLVALIDSDNYLPHKNWLKKMVQPFQEESGIVGSYTWRFAYNKSDNIWNRYFSLLGSADPVGLYLGKADKMSYISDKWIGFGKLMDTNSKYFIVKFDKKNFPTLGSNGFFAKRKLLLKGKSDPEHFFHIDTPFDLLDLGYSEYAVVRDVIIHDTAVRFIPYLKKRARYMQIHYQKRSKQRRYKVFDPSRKIDILRLFLFIGFSSTFVQPLYVAFKGYIKIRDLAWFLHPVFCFSIMATYIIAVLLRLFLNLFNN